ARHIVSRSFQEVLSLLESGKSASEVDRIEVHTREHSLPVEITFRALQGVHGPVVLAVARDISERRRLEVAQHLADHDPLTGLFNRRRFEAELTRHLQHAHRYGAGALLFVDLDGFKAVNDTCGHQTGDELLQMVGAAIAGRLRRTDVVARLGGDEFGALLPDTDMQHAQIAAEDVLIAVREVADRFAEHAPRVSASIGISCFDATVCDEEELLTAADLAMYSAKRSGGDRVHAFDPIDRGDAGAHLSWVERIAGALERDEFVLHCQPIIDLKTRAVWKYEVLLRLPGEGGQLLGPAAFIGAAERHGLIQQVDRWVIGTAIDVIASHAALGRDLPLAVNLSSLTITDASLPAFVEARLERAGVSPTSLIFEITETAALANMQAARDLVVSLKELGCRFALDDFGAGFSSFAALKHLPADYLKIDGGFVCGLVKSRTDQLVVRALVDIARGLGMQTIGEHVEDRETEDVLRECGVDYAQGFLISRPLPIDQVIAATVA
ncbi:MAG TPA: EAL domain-containing protein, partial [Miltoncostaeaceae bacterium]|nr:EAL domain-containing protein [Miltoncostaeaceae bacterium]